MKNPIVTIETENGKIEVELYPDIAPNTVHNFIDLVRKGFYNGTIFHRVIPGSVSYTHLDVYKRQAAESIHYLAEGAPQPDVPVQFAYCCFQ